MIAATTQPNGLSLSGMAVLCAIAATVLTCKYPKVRNAEWRAVRWSARHVWRLLLAGVDRARQRATLAPTKDERRLLARLAPEHWRRHAEIRGLEGTLTARPRLTDAGITAAIRLDGRWTASRLRDAEDHIRALLGARTDLRIEVTPGTRGGWADLVIRTRSAVDDADLKWKPSRRGIGLDMHTGRPVEIPLANRLLLAGASGAGKSVTLRPANAAICADPKAALVMIDLKRVEGALWKTRARIARTPEEVEEVAAELVAEMMARLEELESTGRASWTPTAARPRLVVVVDEGAEVSAVAKGASPALESLARMGRAAEIHLWWCTQKPTMSGASAGIPPQIAAQMDVRLCLRVSTGTEVRTVLGEDATAEGWDAHRLPKPGVLLIRGTGRGPAPVKVWYMDDATVRALPAAPVWRRAGTTPPPIVSMQKTTVAVPKSRADARTAVLAAVEAAPTSGVSIADIQSATGLGKSRVYELVAELVEAGAAVKIRHGRFTAAGKEIAA